MEYINPPCIWKETLITFIDRHIKSVSVTGCTWAEKASDVPLLKESVRKEAARTCLAAPFATSVWQPVLLPWLSLFTFHSSAPQWAPVTSLDLFLLVGPSISWQIPANNERALQLLRNTIRKAWPVSGGWLWAICILFLEILTVVGNLVNMIKGNESISKTQKTQQSSEVLSGQHYLKNKSLNRDLISGTTNSTKTKGAIRRHQPIYLALSYL